jgi:hypothetical protein
MSTILESLGSLITPDVLGAAGKALGVEPATMQKAYAVTGPLLLGGLARAASAPGGADALLKSLPQGTDGILGSLGNLGSMLTGLRSAGSPGGPLAGILGAGTNAIGASLSRALGFNVTPLLSMAAPALLSVVGKAVKEGGLNAGSLASLLDRESADFARNPANAATQATIQQAMDAGAKATRLIESYGADWDRVIAGPVAALYLVASADPSGPVGAVKEAKAAHEALIAAAGKAEPTSLIASAFTGGMTAESVATIRSFARSRGELLDALKASIAAVRQRSPAESGAYNALIQTVGTAAAEAATEGGFLGFGGTKVSKDEQAALEQIRTAIA